MELGCSWWWEGEEEEKLGGRREKAGGGKRGIQEAGAHGERTARETAAAEAAGEGGQ